MTLRTCTITFKEHMKIQIGRGIRTMAPNKSIKLLELGNVMSGRPTHLTDHLVGVKVVDITMAGHKELENNIKSLEKMAADERVVWFEKTYPGIKIIKIESGWVFDAVRNNKMDRRPKAVISCAKDIRWNK